jgi:hypothetical protein
MGEVQGEEEITEKERMTRACLKGCPFFCPRVRHFFVIVVSVAYRLRRGAYFVSVISKITHIFSKSHTSQETAFQLSFV